MNMDNIMATFIGGKLNGMEMKVSEIKSCGYWNGRNSIDWSSARKRGYAVPNVIMDNRPLVTDYVSPSYVGNRLIYMSKDEYMRKGNFFNKFSYRKEKDEY